MSLLAIITFIAVFAMVSCYPNGPPSSACTSLTPGHPASTDSGPAPYELIVNPTSYGPGDQITVTISKTGAEDFRGIIVQARRKTGGSAGTVGTFISPSAGTKLVFCGTTDDTWVHSDRSDKSSVTTTWTAPGSGGEDIVFHASIVQKNDNTGSVFYTGLMTDLAYMGETTTTTTSVYETTAIKDEESEPTPMKTIAGLSDGFVILADVVRLIVAPLNTLEFQVIPLEGLQNVIGLSYDPVGQMVYWTDVDAKIISRSYLDGQGQEIVLQLADDSVPDGIDIDVENGHIYWTDTGLDTIERSKLDGSQRSIVIKLAHPNAEPRAIVVNSANSKIYWTDWGQNVTGIERANTDGTEREILIDSELLWPNGLTIDFAGGRMYWCDAGLNKFESANLDGSDRELVAVFESVHPFDLAVFGEILLWTDWNHGLVIMNVTVDIANQVGVSLIRPSGLHVQHGTTICETIPYQCARDDCIPESWLCDGIDDCAGAEDELFCQVATPTIPTYNTRTTEVQAAGPTPTAPTKSSMNLIDGLVLFSDRSRLIVAPLDNFEFHVIPLKGLQNVIGVSYDPIGQMVYWTDVNKQTISRSFLDGKEQEIVLQLDIDSVPDGIDIDVENGYIFWTDTGLDTIERCNLDGRQRSVVIQLTHSDAEPRAIVVDSANSQLYWTDWGPDIARIERANQDGAEREILIDSDLRWPNGLTIDFTGGRMYWCDAGLHKVESANMDGSNRQLVFFISQLDIHPFDVAIIDGETLLWTDWGLGLIIMNVTNQNTTAVFNIALSRPSGVHVHSGNTTTCETIPYQCARQDCIPEAWLCNDVEDCVGGEDESICHLETQTTPTTTMDVQAPEPTSTAAATKPSLNLTDGIVLIADATRLVVAPLNNFEFQVIPLEGLQNVIGMSYDPVGQMAYWTDVSAKTISRSYLDGQGQETVLQLADNSVPDGMDIDVENGHIYWTDTGLDTIERSKLDGSQRSIVIQLNHSDAEPRAIVVDSRNSKIYWTDWGPGVARIERASTNGTEREIVIDSDLQYPNGLTIDFTEGRMYWCDAGLHKVESANLDGSNRELVFFSSQLDIQPFDVAIFGGETLLWTDWSFIGLVIMNVTNQNTANKFDVAFKRPSGLHVHSGTTSCDMIPYRCDLSECIPEARMCDGIPDCYSAEDERFCARVSTTTLQTQTVITSKAPDVFCMEVINSGRGGFSWPLTLVNETAQSKERCNVTTVHRGKSLAKRKCLPGNGKVGLWDAPILTDCGKFDKFDVQDLENTTVGEGNAVEVAMALEDVTEGLDGNDVTVEDISNIADVIVDIVDVQSNDSQIISSVVGVSSDIVNITSSDSMIKESSKEDLLEVLQALENQLILSIGLGHNISSETEGNIAFTTTAVETQEASLTGFSFAVQQNDDNDIFRPGDITSGYPGQTDTPNTSQTRSSVTLPPSLFQSFGDGNEVGIGFLVHNSDTMFPTDLGNRAVASDIISINVDGLQEMQTLPDPVQMQFQAIGNHPACVFWEFETSSWSEDGCVNAGTTDSGQVICECTHLTNFAVIVAPIDNVKPIITKGPVDKTTTTDPGLSTARVRWNPPIATDDSGSVTLVSNFNPWDAFPIGQTDVIYEATDPSGNQDTYLFSIYVIDLEKPVLQCPNVEEQFAVTDQIEVSVSWPEPTYTDNSGNRGGMNSTYTSPTMFGIGVHNVTYYAWDPSGNTASCIITITVTAACPQNSTVVNSYTLSWLQTPNDDEEVYSDERCDVRTANRGRGLATRVCMQDDNRGAVWQPPLYVGCGEAENFTLGDLPETEVVKSNVDNVAEALINVTQQQSDENEELTPEDVKDIADTFRNIVDVESDEPEVTTSIIEIANIFVNLAEQTDNTTPKESSAVYINDILLAIEQQVNRTTASGQNLTTIEPNIAVTIDTVEPDPNSTGFSFAVTGNKGEEFKENNIQTYPNPEDLPDPDERRTAVTLPAVIFNSTPKNATDTIGVSFVVHNSAVLFPTNNTNQTVASDIVSAIVTGVETIKNLQEPVVLEFTAEGNHAECVFWDFTIENWSQEGCELSESESKGKRVVCHCNHLTNFAVLVDANYDVGPFVLDLVSKIGCGVSMLALLITLVIFIGFRRLRIGSNATPRKILMNLCVALFLLYFVFLFGIDQNSHRNGCICVAFLLQYLTLASLMWMAVEGFNLYQVVIRVFEAQIEKFVFKSAIVAWGLPLIISAISLGAGFSNYDHLKYCFVRESALSFGVVLPVSCILFFNFAMFTRVSYTLCRANLGGNATQRSNTKKSIERLQNAFTMSILMGLTWVFGLFAIEEASFVFSLIFCVCNSFQGLVLFLVFCARQEDVRKMLRPYIMRITGRSDTEVSRAPTVSTGFSSGTVKSPYDDMDFSSSKSPYNDIDFSSAAAVPMSDIQANNPTYDTAGNFIGKDVSSFACVGDSKKADVTESIFLAPGSKNKVKSEVLLADNPTYDSTGDRVIGQIHKPAEKKIDESQVQTKSSFATNGANTTEQEADVPQDNITHGDEVGQDNPSYEDAEELVGQVNISAESKNDEFGDDTNVTSSATDADNTVRVDND